MKQFIIILIPALFIGCGARNKTINTKEDAEMQEEIDSATTSIFGDLNEEFETEQAVEIDSLFAYINRTPCFGYCAEYTLKVYDSGYCTYEGKSNVENIGKYESWVDSGILQKIKDLADEAGYFELGDEYDDMVTDLPTTNTCLDFDGKHKKIKNRYMAPQELNDFEDAFDALFKDVEWKKLPTNN